MIRIHTVSWPPPLQHTLQHSIDCLIASTNSAIAISRGTESIAQRTDACRCN